MTDKKIIVYGTESCPYCHMAKDFLKEKGIEFKYIDVSKDEKAARYMIDKTGQTGVPVIEIGDQFIIGFNKVEIEKALA